MKHTALAGWFAIGLILAAPAKAIDAAPLVRNIVTDYPVDDAERHDEISAVLQRAVDEVGARGGGTVLIPARVGQWRLNRPVFVGYPNVTIAGEGAGTRITGSGIMIVLGIKPQYAEQIAAGHFPAISGAAGVLDASMKDPKFGLRTFDGKVRASGYFPACPLAFGNKVGRDPSGDYWKDYELGSGKPAYWQNWPRYTINLAIRNNTATPMRGVICGVGAGGLSPGLTKGNIDDPLTIWTIESDPVTGADLAFKFKILDKEGKESVRSLLLSHLPAGQGTHRICVQLDFSTGRCRAWHSTSTKEPVQPTLSAKVDLGAGYRFKAFEYGALQLGRITGSSFSGSPSDGKTVGDWTYCGLSLFGEPRYSLDGQSDQLRAPQISLIGAKSPADDRYRFFPDPYEHGLISFLPLASAIQQTAVGQSTVVYRNGQEYDGTEGTGFWWPERAVEPVTGTLSLRDMQLFAASNHGAPVVVGAASHVVMENIYEGGGGYHGVGSLHCEPAGSVLELRNCRLVGWDASLYAHDQNIRAQNLSGGSGETIIRLVGCRGALDHVIVTGFVASDYYVKLHAGARGGPLRISEFCIDNEGISWAPRKACFYAEPSLDGGKEGNVLSFFGTIYTGALINGQAVVELADPPGAAEAKPTARLVIDGVDLMADVKKPAGCIVLSRSSRWSGDIRLAETSWLDRLSYGVIHHTDLGPCRIVSHHDDASALPTKGTWLVGCHVFRIADHQDPKSGAWNFKTWRCVRGGTYATAQEPIWNEVTP
jgi:hypothetical protein